MTLGTLDLMNIRTVEHLAVFIHAHRNRIADIPHLLRTGIGSIAEAAPAPMVTVLISRDDVDIAMAPTPVLVRMATPSAQAKAGNAAVIELAVARYQNAIEEAMVAPPVSPELHNALAAAPASQPDMPSAQTGNPVQLASLGSAIIPPVASLASPVELSRKRK